jgi:hypothetical protein
MNPKQTNEEEEDNRPTLFAPTIQTYHFPTGQHDIDLTDPTLILEHLLESGVATVTWTCWSVSRQFGINSW